MEDRPNVHDDRRKPPVEPEKPQEEAEPVETTVPLFRIPYRHSRPIRKVGKARIHRKFQELKPKQRERLVRRKLSKGVDAGLIEDPEIVIHDPKPHQKAKSKCEFCFFDFPTPLAICPRCGNCQDCGLYSPDAERQVCIFCGNTLQGKTLKSMKNRRKNVRIRGKSYRDHRNKGV